MYADVRALGRCQGQRRACHRQGCRWYYQGASGDAHGVQDAQARLDRPHAQDGGEKFCL